MIQLTSKKFKDMSQRQKAEEDIVIVDGDSVGEGPHRGHHVFVCDLHPFGHPCGPAGVHDDGDVISRRRYPNYVKTGCCRVN